MKRINFIITWEMWELLRNKSFAENRSVASIIREAIEDMFEIGD